MISNKFLAPLLGKVRFGVWISILVKDEFANLCKKKKISNSYFAKISIKTPNLIFPDNDAKNLLLTASERVVQVIKWFSITNQDRSHEEGVVLMRIEYPSY